MNCSDERLRRVVPKAAQLKHKHVVNVGAGLYLIHYFLKAEGVP